MQLRHESPGSWCHNGDSDKKNWLSKNKKSTNSEKQIIVVDTDVPLMFLYHSLTYTVHQTGLSDNSKLDM